jgi:uncharacterized membrane protein YgdD (TMEM256/DUF423 family)
LKRNFIIIAAILGAIAVMLGAFGAHALKATLTTEQLQTYETGVRYHFYHVIALLAAAILYKEYPSKLLVWAGNLFIAGIMLFSGSLYLLSNISSLKVLGMVTPLGGVCFIAGWLLLATGCRKKIKNQE